MATANARIGLAAEAPKSGASIMFADAKSKQRFDEYRSLLEQDPSKYADQIATIRQLERSDVQYVISVCGGLGNGVEGKLSSDGERVIIYITDVGGPGAETASLHSRFAHELEHARQFDAGELGLARDPRTGHWASHYGSYDIGDEVAAWRAQLGVASAHDFWRRRDGISVPTVLRLFKDARTDEERAKVLVQNGYKNVNPIFSSNVRFAAAAGHAAGDVVRPDLSRGENLFGRVFDVVADAPGAAGPAAGDASRRD
jgi:hypothetical protein